jgi:hypothetical protein
MPTEAQKAAERAGAARMASVILDRRTPAEAKRLKELTKQIKTSHQNLIVNFDRTLKSAARWSSAIYCSK